MMEPAEMMNRFSKAVPEISCKEHLAIVPGIDDGRHSSGPAATDDIPDAAVGFMNEYADVFSELAKCVGL